MKSNLANPLHEGHFADVNGVQMHYTLHGDGAPLVLLHGCTASSLQWHPYIGPLSEHYRLIVPDLRGHGYSLDPANEFTLAQAAQDITDLLDHLGIASYKAIGCSAGGCMLQYMSMAQPERIEAMILDSCGSYFPEQTCNALYQWAESDDEELKSNEHYHSNGIIQLRSLIQQLPKIVDHYNAHPPDLSRISTKTLIALGDRDALYPVSMAFDMYLSVLLKNVVFCLHLLTVS